MRLRPRKSEGLIDAADYLQTCRLAGNSSARPARFECATSRSGGGRRKKLRKRRNGSSMRREGYVLTRRFPRDPFRYRASPMDLAHQTGWVGQKPSGRISAQHREVLPADGSPLAPRMHIQLRKKCSIIEVRGIRAPREARQSRGAPEDGKWQPVVPVHRRCRREAPQSHQLQAPEDNRRALAAHTPTLTPMRSSTVTQDIEDIEAGKSGRSLLLSPCEAETLASPHLKQGPARWALHGSAVDGQPSRPVATLDPKPVGPCAVVAPSSRSMFCRWQRPRSARPRPARPRRT